jgi:hypothetical protein
MTQITSLGAANYERTHAEHFTFVDPRYHGQSDAMVATAKGLVDAFERRGVPRRHVCVSVRTHSSLL